jgi:esterase/lipase
MLAEKGFSAMTLSLSGHGNSDGKIEDQTRQKSLQETLAAYDLFKSKLPADTKIGVVGNSYGGYMAAILSTQREVACLSIRVPANYPDEGFEQPQAGRGHDDPAVAKWRLQKLNFNNTRSLNAIHQFKGPIQILEAEKDELIPHQCVQNYVDAVKDKSKLDYQLLKDWPHSMGPDPERNRQYQEILLSWLQQQV